VPIGIYMIRDAAVCAAPERRAEAGTQLLRLALAHHLDTDTGAWQIGRAANGARIVTAGPGPLPALSVTHSGDLLAVAVALVGKHGVGKQGVGQHGVGKQGVGKQGVGEHEAGQHASGHGDVTAVGGIGIDVERPRSRSYGKIARHMGWPKSLWAQPQVPTQDEFLHIWTLWESLYKALPDGSLADLRAALSAAGGIKAGTAGTVAAADWSACSRRSSDGSWLSVVTQPAHTSATCLFRVDRLAGDVDSARIQTITAPEGEFHF
jgi:phosphopantetheinyl transferase